MHYTNQSVYGTTSHLFSGFVTTALCFSWFYLCWRSVLYSGTASGSLSFTWLNALGWVQACAALDLCVRSRAQGPVTHPQCGDWGVSCCCCCLCKHTLFAFRHICSPWPLHHGNSAIPEGFCCGRPRLCGQYTTNHLLSTANRKAIRSCRNAFCPCRYFRKVIFDFCCSPSPN